MKLGRPQAIPPKVYGEVTRLHSLGYGYQRIVSMVAGQGVYATKSSVARLIRGQAPYAPG